jgi:hypothetical protein
LGVQSWRITRYASKKTLNTTALPCHKRASKSFVLYWGMSHSRQTSPVQNTVDIVSTGKGYTKPFVSLELLALVMLQLADMFLCCTLRSVVMACRLMAYVTTEAWAWACWAVLYGLSSILLLSEFSCMKLTMYLDKRVNLLKRGDVTEVYNTQNRWVCELCPSFSPVLLGSLEQWSSTWGTGTRKYVMGYVNLHGLSPRPNYTDRATAACRRSDCQLLRIEGVTWSAWRIPTAVFSVF